MNCLRKLTWMYSVLPMRVHNVSFRKYSSHLKLIHRYKVNDLLIPGRSYDCSKQGLFTTAIDFQVPDKKKRGDLSSKPHLREYARVDLQKKPVPESEDEDSILFDEDYSRLIHNCSGAMFDHVDRTGNIAVIQPWVKWGPMKRHDTSKELLLEEACALVRTFSSCNIVYKEIVTVQRASNSKLFGDGQLDRLHEELGRHKPLVGVFISYEVLTKAHKRELEEALHVKVLDRYSIVLAIFQQHASSLEAKLQVALAEIPYVRHHLKDDRHRLILAQREKKLKASLEDLSDRREKTRKVRQNSDVPSVAIVGYTNAGKTSLIRALTGDDNVIGEDYLFATLDVTAHKCSLPCGLPILLLDTVGFIQDIPTSLIASFISTLEDAVCADIVVHVRDSSHPDYNCQSATVVDTLRSLPLPGETPIITIDSKIDVAPYAPRYGEDYLQTDSTSNFIQVSAKTGKGLDELLVAIEAEVLGKLQKQEVHLRLLTGSPEISWLRNIVGIIKEESDANNPQCTIVSTVMNERDMADFKKFMKSNH